MARNNFDDFGCPNCRKKYNRTILPPIRSKVVCKDCATVFHHNMDSFSGSWTITGALITLFSSFAFLSISLLNSTGDETPNFLQLILAVGYSGLLACALAIWGGFLGKAFGMLVGYIMLLPGKTTDVEGDSTESTGIDVRHFDKFVPMIWTVYGICVPIYWFLFLLEINLGAYSRLAFYSFPVVTLFVIWLMRFKIGKADGLTYRSVLHSILIVSFFLFNYGMYGMLEFLVSNLGYDNFNNTNWPLPHFGNLSK